MTARRRTDNEDEVLGDIAVALSASADKFISPPPTEPELPIKVKTCEAKKLLSPSVMELLQSFPENPTVRTMVEVQLKQPIPADKLTFKDIIEWVEYNPAFSNIKPRPEGVLIFTICKSGTESGTCRYSVDTYGDQEFKITDTQLKELVRDCDDWDVFWECLVEYVTNNEEIQMEHSGDENTNHHEATGSEDEGWMWASDHVPVETIKTRLRELLDRDALEKLEL
jgi:hypothetical protein